MKWKNVSKDELPPNGAEVLVSVKGVYYVAVYDAAAKTFEEILYHKRFAVTGKETIYWSEIEKPESK